VNTASAVRAALPAADALEARFGLRVAARLSEANRQLPHDISERLRVARQQALAQVPAKVTAQRTAAAKAPAVVAVGRGVGGVMGGDEPSSWWMRLGGLVPLAALLAGVVFIHEWTYREQITAAANIDTALLSDALPPAAYSDPGFDEFLRTSDADTPTTTASPQ
jgi:hypothetical protein